MTSKLHDDDDNDGDGDGDGGGDDDGDNGDKGDDKNMPRGITHQYSLWITIALTDCFNKTALSTAW